MVSGLGGSSGLGGGQSERGTYSQVHPEDTGAWQAGSTERIAAAQADLAMAQASSVEAIAQREQAFAEWQGQQQLHISGLEEQVRATARQVDQQVLDHELGLAQQLQALEAQLAQYETGITGAQTEAANPYAPGGRFAGRLTPTRPPRAPAPV